LGILVPIVTKQGTCFEVSIHRVDTNVSGRMAVQEMEVKNQSKRSVETVCLTM